MNSWYIIIPVGKQLVLLEKRAKESKKNFRKVLTSKVKFAMIDKSPRKRAKKQKRI